MATMDIEMASSIGPMVNMGYDQSHDSFGIPVYQSEVDLCQLLQAMSLTKGKFKALETATVEAVPSASPNANAHDASTEDLACNPDGSESSSSRSSSYDRPHADRLLTSSTTVPAGPSQPPACHFLQSILASLAPESPALSPSPYPYPSLGAFQTTNGAYLDTLLVHRGLLSAFPPAHKGCGVALHEIARAIEVRAWRSDRDSDADAVAALRHEAYVVAHWV